MSISRRLEALEEKIRPHPVHAGSSAARERMREHLDRIAALRRGESSEEEEAEVEAVSAAVERRLDEIRGEVHR